ncbi:MAG: UDP-N-acetylglucosamine 2-epimerase (non-hydrolyzing) [Chloroflexi bacterium]|nr:UDP-N-acetylglucosamine 2-epimerase (non-hydrolyzing) [Chloroflexota bacterium]
MAPVVKELERHRERLEPVVCVTAQHRQMLDQVLEHFQISPKIDLALMREDQDLPSLTARAMTALSETLKAELPGLVLVQGDTTTAMVGAMAAFYQKVAVGHVEAGLRTRNPYSPFPEEMNRRIIGALAAYHFAPTTTAAASLLAESVPQDHIFTTGNTVIDALHWTAAREPSAEARKLLKKLGLDGREQHRLVLVTAHRRENFGQPLENICLALRETARRNRDVTVVYPVHMNPNVRGPVHSLLAGEERIHLTDPLPYEPFVHLMARSYLVLTDSGGIQEEAPALGKPVLVMRRETERPEAVEAGTARVVGTDTESIVAATERLLHDGAEYERMAHAVSPYGDGHAAERIVATILERCA